jgi:hypothetical protein
MAGRERGVVSYVKKGFAGPDPCIHRRVAPDELPLKSQFVFKVADGCKHIFCPDDRNRRAVIVQNHGVFRVQTIFLETEAALSV